MKRQKMMYSAIVLVTLLALFGCSGGDSGGDGGGSATSGITAIPDFNPFPTAFTGNGDVKNLTIANLDKIFANEWAKVVRVCIGENVGMSVVDNAALPSGTSVSFQIIGVGQMSFELYGLDASGNKVYLWTKNPDMEPWFHQLRTYKRIGLVIAANGMISPLPSGVFIVPRVFKVDEFGTCYMAAWALSAEKSINEIQSISEKYWDVTGGSYDGLGANQASLKDAWVEVIPGLENGDTKIRTEALLTNGSVVRGKVWFLREIGSTDVHPTEDYFLVNYIRGQEDPSAPTEAFIKFSEPSFLKDGKLFVTETEALVSVQFRNGYTPTFFFNDEDITDLFGELVLGGGLWAANLATPEERGYTLVIGFLDASDNEYEASQFFQVIFPVEILEIDRGDFLWNVEGGTGSIDLNTGLIVVNEGANKIPDLQVRKELLNGFLESGYVYLLEGNITSSSDVDGSSLKPRFQLRESAGDYYPYFSANIICDGEVFVVMEPTFDEVNGKNGNDTSFLIQFGGDGAGTLQLPATIKIKKVLLP